MNDVQKFILNRAMQKLANAEEQIRQIPWKYAKDRAHAYKAQNTDDQIGDWETPGAGTSKIEKIVLPFLYLHRYTTDNLPYLREQQAKSQASKLNTVPGSDEYNALVKYLIEQGETNWYNFNNPKNPKPNVKAPTAKDEDGKVIDPKRIKNAGRTMVSTDNYKKFSGNV